MMNNIIRMSKNNVEIDIDRQSTMQSTTLVQIKILIDHWNGTEADLIDTIRNLVMEELDALR